MIYAALGWGVDRISFLLGHVNGIIFHQNRAFAIRAVKLHVFNRFMGIVLETSQKSYVIFINVLVKCKLLRPT